MVTAQAVGVAPPALSRGQMTRCVKQGGFPGRRNGRRVPGREWGMKGGTLPRQRDPQRGSRWRGRVLGDFWGGATRLRGCGAWELGRGGRWDRGWRGAGGPVQGGGAGGAGERRGRRGESLPREDARGGVPRVEGGGRGRARGEPQRGGSARRAIVHDYDYRRRRGRRGCVGGRIAGHPDVFRR